MGGDSGVAAAFDTGTIVLIVAVLIFYLRLILIQRERAKRLKRQPASSPKKKKGPEATSETVERFSIISRNPRNRVIAGIGFLAILAGLFLYLKWIPAPSAQSYWWLPTAIGIVAFSWGFE